jgi:transposase
MERYIGLDVHAASCTLAVIGPSGRRLKAVVVETNGTALVETVRQVPGTRRLCLEEGTQSTWLYSLLKPHVQQIVVTQARRRRSVGPKSDLSDAYMLADQLRRGDLDSVIYKGLGEYERLRELARAHRMLTQDVVRAQARIKSIFRGHGIKTSIRGVYGGQRAHYLEQLAKPQYELAQALCDEYDGVRSVLERIDKELVKEARAQRAGRLLQTVPGLGWQRIAQLLPIVVTPHRFRTRQAFWSYCGLGVVTRSSADWVQAPEGGWSRANVMQTRGLTRKCNRNLKNVFKGAAHTVLTMPGRADNELYRRYERWLEAGTKPPLAKVSLARKIATITWTVWRKGEPYDGTRVLK